MAVEVDAEDSRFTAGAATATAAGADPFSAGESRPLARRGERVWLGVGAFVFCPCFSRSSRSRSFLIAAVAALNLLMGAFVLVGVPLPLD